MAPVRRLSSRLSQHLDRRGVVLIVLGLIFALYGLGIALAPSKRFRDLGSGWWEMTLNSRWWAGMWLLCGSVAVLVGVLHAARRLTSDALGWDALLIPVSLWSVLYAITLLLYLATLGALGDSRAWFGLLLWGALLFLVLVLAGWPDPRWSPAQPGEPGLRLHE